MQGNLKRQKLVLVSILLAVLFTYPFISIANKVALTGGIPVLYAYIFLVWLISIIVLYRLADHRQKGNDE